MLDWLFDVPKKTFREEGYWILFPLTTKPGPKTVLSKEEEDLIFWHCITMSEMGYGIGRDDLMVVGFRVVEKSGRPHPFKKAPLRGHGWKVF